jgi:hypothetical protein
VAEKKPRARTFRGPEALLTGFRALAFCLFYCPLK